MTGLLIDGDAAHDAAQRELAKPIYPKPSLTERLMGWFDELLYKLFADGSAIPGGWLTLTLLLTVLIVAAVVAVRVARRTMRTNRGTEPALFDSQALSAAEHRAIAEQCAAQGDWAAAIRHRLRAVARRFEEIDVLDPVPGRTATELARDAGARRPALTPGLQRAADTFNDVTYGAQTGSEAGYRQIADLETQVR